MAICKLNHNLTRTASCGYNLPQIVDLFLANYEDVSATSISSGDCQEEITAITLASGSKWLHIEPAKNSASFEDTLVVEDNGNKYRNASVTFNVSGKYNACLHDALDALSLGRYLVVVKTADGNYLALGRIAPLEAETATLQGGSDANGLAVTLSGNVAETPLTLSEAAVTALLANVNED